VAAVVFCQPAAVDWSMINGRIVVEEGQLTTLDLQPHIERHNALAAAMIRGDA
jgi:hypothetical protein